MNIIENCICGHCGQEDDLGKTINNEETNNTDQYWCFECTKESK